MIIYKDLFTEDELFTDIIKIELLNEVVYKLKGKLRTDSDNVDGSLIGANVSAEGGDEGTQDSSKTGVDIVLNCRLVEYANTKKDYLKYIKDYMKRVNTHLKEENPDEVEVFQSNVQKFIKEVVSEFDEYQFFCGESMHPDGMLALMKWEGETPYMYFFKHGLIAEKV